MSATETNENRIILSKHKADILMTLSYLDVAAHLISRGVISMQEHREIITYTDEVSRAKKLIDIISERKNAVDHLVDGMRDPIQKGKYKYLIKTLQR